MSRASQERQPQIPRLATASIQHEFPPVRFQGFQMPNPKSIVCLAALTLIAGPLTVVECGTAPQPVATEPSPQPLPVPESQRPGAGQSDQLHPASRGRGFPGSPSGADQPGPSSGPVTGSPTPVGPNSGLGLGQRPRRTLDIPSAEQDYPVFGPPPGLGTPMERNRIRGGPGYPGLRGPGTGYPKHRQYANPPRYPSRAPQ